MSVSLKLIEGAAVSYVNEVDVHSSVPVVALSVVTFPTLSYALIQRYFVPSPSPPADFALNTFPNFSSSNSTVDDHTPFDETSIPVT